MTRCQEVHYKKLLKDPREAELLDMLLFRKPPKTIKHPLFEHILVKDKTDERDRRLKAVKKIVGEFEECISRHGTGREWIIADIPEKDVVFTKKPHTKAEKDSARDTLKIVDKKGGVSLITDRSNSLMKHLGDFVNFVPNVYANEHAYALLKKKKLIE